MATARPGARTTRTRPNSAIYVGPSGANGSAVNLRDRDNRDDYGPRTATIRSAMKRPSHSHSHSFSSSAFSSSVVDLPEPPSPSRSVSSGLPSPPATNSEPGSEKMTLTEANLRALDGDGPDEDNTARLSSLSRVQSLTDRNRAALDRISRLSTPSPKPSLSSGSTHSKSRSEGVRYALSPREASGSETEREDGSYYSGSGNGNGNSNTTTSVRERVLSVPASPSKPRTPNSPRKRASLAFDMTSIRGGGAVEAALAAVASSRRGSANKGKERAGLPREWRANDSRRGMSEDLRNMDYEPPGGGRAQKTRGGSAESGLTLRNDPPRAPSTLSRYSGGTGGSAGTGGGGGLMRESLVSFENQMTRAFELDLGADAESERRGRELVRGAQGVVAAAERIAGVLKSGNARALEEQISAEIDGDRGGSRASNLAQVWRGVGSDFREGVRASDELARAVTAFLLGVGKVIKERERDSRPESRSASRADRTRSVSRLDAYADRERERSVSRLERERSISSHFDDRDRDDRERSISRSGGRYELPTRSQTSVGYSSRRPLREWEDSPTPAPRAARQPVLETPAPRRTQTVDFRTPARREEVRTRTPLSSNSTKSPPYRDTISASGHRPPPIDTTHEYATIGTRTNRSRRGTLSSIFPMSTGTPTTAVTSQDDDRATFSRPPDGRAEEGLRRARTISGGEPEPISRTPSTSTHSSSSRSSHPRTPSSPEVLMSPMSGEETEKPPGWRSRSGTIGRSGRVSLDGLIGVGRDRAADRAAAQSTTTRRR